MTYYYANGTFGVVAFETCPFDDINVDAKFWTPMTEAWADCPSSTGIGGDVKWSGEYWPIPVQKVLDAQQRCRDSLAALLAKRGEAPPAYPLAAPHV